MLISVLLVNWLSVVENSFIYCSSFSLCVKFLDHIVLPYSLDMTTPSPELASCVVFTIILSVWDGVYL